MTLIGKRVEVSPVDFEAFSRPRFHAHVGAWGVGRRAHPMQVLFQNAQTTAEAERPESLCDHRGRDMRMLLQELGDGGLEGIQLARALTGSGGLRRGDEIFGDGSAPDVQMTGDFAHRPVLGPVQAMNFVDLLGAQHGSEVGYGQDRKNAIGLFFSSTRRSLSPVAKLLEDKDLHGS